MIKKIFKISLALIIGCFFLWLAFRNVQLEKLWNLVKTINFFWILPFGLTLLVSHILRAERWRLLIQHDKPDVSRVTLTAGVLTGYLLNLVGPRLGEVSRPVYVAKREQLSSSKLIGTIVLERIIDLATLILLIIVVAVYLIADMTLLREIFGDTTINFLTNGLPFNTTVWIIVGLVLVALLGYITIKIIEFVAERVDKVRWWVDKVKLVLAQFKDGLLAAREVDHWGLFIGYTAMIWGCYTLMSYIPFAMFDMHEVYGLGLIEAVAITVISGIGIALPVPGGIGTYHYFVKQSLHVLFAVPAVTGLAYATVTHATTMIFVVFYTPISLFVDKWWTAKKGVKPS